MIAEGMEAWSNDYFRRIRRHWMLSHWRTKKKEQPLHPLLHSLCL